jgi:hypothetical protein
MKPLPSAAFALLVKQPLFDFLLLRRIALDGHASFIRRQEIHQPC